MQSNSRYVFPRVIAALLIREMITRYGRTPGGYLWALLEPIGMVVLLSLVFSQFIHVPPLGTSFALFYATGYIPFHAYMDFSSNTSNALAVNRQLLHLPMVRPLDTIIARYILSLLTLVLTSLIIFGSMLYIIDDRTAVDPAPLLAALCLATLLGLGVGTLNSVIFLFFPVWQRLWAILMRPMFLISGVFFTLESLPQQVQEVITWNPVIHAVGLARSGFYPTYDAVYVDWAYVLFIAVTTFISGGILLHRHSGRFIEMS